MDLCLWRILIFIFLILQAPLSRAEEFWQTRLKKMCGGITVDEVNNSKSQQTRECEYGANSIKSEVANVIKEIRPLIHAAAEKYGVDPRAIVGCILAEHSMNTGIGDIAQNFLVKSGLAPKGELFGKQFTFGFGQLHNTRARSVEALAAETEGRPIRSDQEIDNAILSVEGSTYYIAALLKQATLIYANAGYDIANDVGVLTSLYNMGKVNERLARTISEKRLPKPNYFGLFVEMHNSDIEKIVGKIPKKQTHKTEEEDVTPPPAQQVQTSKPVKKTNVYEMTSEIKLSNGPTACYDEPVFKNDHIKVEKNTWTKTVGTGIDCEGEPWRIVETSDGKVGWIDEKLFLKNSIKRSIPADRCTTTENEPCNQQLSENLKDYATGKKGSDLKFALKQKEVSQPPLPTQFDEIFAQSPLKDLKDVDAAKMSLPSPITKDVCLQMQKANQEFISRVAEEMDFPDFESFTSYSNPYRNIPINFSCSGDIPDRYIKVDAYVNWLNGLKIIKNPTAENLATPEDAKVADAEIISRVKIKNDPKGSLRKIFSNLEYCEKVAAKFPRTRTLLYAVRDMILKKLKLTSEESFKTRYYGSRIDYGSGIDSGFVTRLDSARDYCRGIEKIGESCESESQSLPHIAPSGNPNIVQAWAQNTCTTKVMDPASESLNQLELPLDAAKKLFKRDQDMDDSLYTALKAIFGEPNSSQTGKTRIYTLRALVDAILANSCVNAVFVPNYWLGVKDKVVYRPNKDKENEVLVRTSTTSCNPGDP